MVDGNMTQWDTHVLRAVRQASTRSYGAQRGYVDLDDLQQEGYLWVLANQEKVDGWLDEGRDGFALLQHAIYQHLHKYTMKERYRKDGTEPGDYYNYRVVVIADLLPDVFNEEPSFGHSSSDLGTMIRSSKQPSEGGDRMAMIADIKAGDTIFHNGHLKTVCGCNIKRDAFLGTSLFGDTYMGGRAMVSKADIFRALPARA